MTAAVQKPSDRQMYKTPASICVADTISIQYILGVEGTTYASVAAIWKPFNLPKKHTLEERGPKEKEEEKKGIKGSEGQRKRRVNAG